MHSSVYIYWAVSTITMNYAGLIIHVQVMVWTYFFTSLGIYLGMDFAGKSVSNCQTVFQSDCTIFYDFSTNE